MSTFSIVRCPNVKNISAFKRIFVEQAEFAVNSIFLPCGGYGYGASLSSSGSIGYYWSSVPNSDSNYSWRLDFYSSRYRMDGSRRLFGRSVRPVQGFTK